jgi:hypothetical protein
MTCRDVGAAVAAALTAATTVPVTSMMTHKRIFFSFSRADEAKMHTEIIRGVVVLGTLKVQVRKVRYGFPRASKVDDLTAGEDHQQICTQDVNM